VTGATRDAPAEAADDRREPLSWTGPRIVGVVLLALGVLTLLAALDVSGTGKVSGPRFAPLVASSALIVLSVAFLVRTFVRPDVELARHAMREMEGTHWPTPAALLGLLVGYALLLTALGYALATTIFFWLTAWLLGSEKPARDAVIGVVLGVVAGYAFSRWLNVQLPTGPWGV
jgi:putative tricarboxylic transport membrane protein